MKAVKEGHDTLFLTFIIKKSRVERPNMGNND